MEEEKTTEQRIVKEYDVGYGKTPVETRWKPGQSGNYKRRKSFATLFDKAIKKIAEINLERRIYLSPLKLRK